MHYAITAEFARQQQHAMHRRAHHARLTRQAASASLRPNPLIRRRWRQVQ